MMRTMNTDIKDDDIIVELLDFPVFDIDLYRQYLETGEVWQSVRMVSVEEIQKTYEK